MIAFDVDVLRREFPALGLEEGGEPVALFDGPGGTQVPRRVIDAMSRYYRTSNANEGGAFGTSRRSDAAVLEARAAMADFLGARSVQEIKFGQNMSSLTLHASRSIAASLRPGDEIVVTTLDHEANVSPWRLVADDRGLKVRTVDIRPGDGTLDLDSFDAALSDRTRLVAFGWASNALGTINPVAELVRRAHDAGALTYVDAVHWAPHGPIDVHALGTDFLACSTYKFFGPHLGVLFGRAELMDRLPAYKVRPAHDRWETGTPNFEGIVGAAAAIDYLASVGERFGAPFVSQAGRVTGRRLILRTGMLAIRSYEMTLFERLLAGLQAIPGVRVWGVADRARLASERTPTASITIRGVAPRAAAEALGRKGIATWDGDFYAQSLVERLGLADSGGLLRLGIVHYNTAAEVDRLLGALAEIAGSAKPAAVANVGASSG
jgi:cysteine desulfurase family protein (TIGR01976 family)